ncbi:DUF4429 domain-containing protein [Streptomyces virginiae]|uniref:DUF4429 domain-containing protein n=1 Tax=Streptomyces virginiae TaxID=1961 RepID=UPI002253C31E|nr:DUF4429 domain-containing protein [Streptomyces virginiae]MCX5176714.1 DUF4429 domain-containing protein [Streptomyces virginiae]
MKIKGVQGSVSFDGEWITIVKRAVGAQPREFRLRAADITGTRFKPATRLFHGYVQFLLPGSAPAVESSGPLSGGRPPHSDPHSLSIPHRSNDGIAMLVDAVETANR